MENLPYLKEALSQTISRLRKDAGMSQQTLAERSNLSRVYVVQIEGRLFRPTLNAVFKLAQGLNMDVADLVSLISQERELIMRQDYQQPQC